MVQPGWYRRLLWAVAVLVVAVVPAATARGVYVTMVDNGPSSNRVDIVFMGDGYLASDIETTYVGHINAMLDHLFREGEAPFPRYEHFFNVHRINVVSNERGADVPPLGIYRDTALDATYYFDGTTERLLSIDAGKGMTALNAGLSGAPFTAEMRLVTINDTRYGGGGGFFATYAGGNSSATEVALHELGHSFSNLADEYDYGSGTYTGGEPSEPNVTTNPLGAKWANWIGYNQPGLGVIGAYEGGLYVAKGIYRPSLNSKMRSLGTPFNAVSIEKIVRDIYAKVRPLDAYRPNAGTIYDPGGIWVDTVDPEVIQVGWSVNGTSVADADGESFRLEQFGYANGQYTVTARAFDDTPYVRGDRSALEQSVAWTIRLTLVPSAGRWTLPGDGYWSTGSNWRGTVPNGDGAWATFPGGSPTPRTVTLTTPETVGTLIFEGGGYTLTGADAVPLTIKAASSRDGWISAQAGDHTIAARVLVNSTTDLDVASGASLAFSGPLEIGAAQTLTATGAGLLAISGPQAHMAGSILNTSGGTTRLASDAGAGGANLTVNSTSSLEFQATQHLKALSLTSGQCRLTASGARVIVTASLAIDPARAALDLADNSLIVDYPEGAASPLTGVRDWIASGLDLAGGGYWDGLGIHSSAAAGRADRLTALGVLDNGDAVVGGRTQFAGETVDVTSVLAAYTWWGDVNLDGVVDANDYDVIDRDFLFEPPPEDMGWWTGDINFDGLIDANDYDLIDRAFLLQTGPLGGNAPVAAPAPEPATLALVLVGLGGLAASRRR